MQAEENIRKLMDRLEAMTTTLGEEGFDKLYPSEVETVYSYSCTVCDVLSWVLTDESSANDENTSIFLKNIVLGNWGWDSPEEFVKDVMARRSPTKDA